MDNDIELRIIAIIDKIRPFLISDGGNLEFVKYDAENNVILVKGNVPGAKNSYVVVTNAVKAKNASLNPESLA